MLERELPAAIGVVPAPVSPNRSCAFGKVISVSLLATGWLGRHLAISGWTDPGSDLVAEPPKAI